MAAVERIDSIYNIPALEQEHAALQKFLQQDATAIVNLYENIERFQGKSNVATVSKNWESVTNAMVGASSASDALIGIQKQLNDQIAKTAQLEKQLADAISKGDTVRKKRKDMTDDEIRSNIESKKSIQDRTKEIIAQTDAYKALDLANSQAAAKAKTLQAKAIQTGNPEDKAVADKASQEAKGLSDQLKRIDSTVGESKRKVGSYTDALRILEEELASVNVQLADMEKQEKKVSSATNLTARNPIGFKQGGASGTTPDPANTATGNVTNSAIGFDANRYKELKQQAADLNIILGVQSKGFSSVTQEVRASERALQTLRAKGYEDTEMFKKLRNATVEQNKEQKEFQRQQKLLEGEAPLLGSLALAAKGLAGAYAVGAGAVALFAEGNEKVEKELNRLVAIMTILQGLKEAYELIQEAGAIRLAIETTLTKVYNAVLGETVVNTKTAAVAKEELTATSIQLSIAFQEEVAVGEQLSLAFAELTAENEALAISQAEVAAATEAETAAMAELAAATEAAATATAIATGIGIALAAIAAIIVAIQYWNKSSAMSVKQQGELAESIGKANELIVQQVEFMSSLDQATKKYYENQLALSAAAGLNEEKNFALRKALGKEELRLAQDEVDQLGASYTGNARLAESIKMLNDRRQEAVDIQIKIKSIREADQTGDQKRELESAIKLEELYTKQLAGPKALYDASKKALAERDAARQKDAQDELKEDKFNADERRKVLVESIKIEADLIESRNEIILNDDRSNLAQRLNALESNTKQRRRIIEADRINVVSNPGSSSADIKLANEKAAEENRKLIIQTAEEERKVKYSYYVRDRDAQMEIFKLEQQDKINQAQVILDLEKGTFNQRMAAQTKNYEAQRSILGAEFLKQLDDQTLTDKERLRISKNYETSLIKLDQDFSKIRQEEAKRQREKGLKEQDDYYAKQKDATKTRNNDAAIALNDKFTSGKISADTFDQQKEIQAYQAQKDALSDLIKEDNNRVNNFKEGTKERADAEAELAQHGRDLSDLNADWEEKNIKKVTALRKEAQKEVEQAVVALVDASFEHELNNIQKQIDANDKLKEAETKRIAGSTLDEQQKANAITVIDKQTEANNEALQRRQRDIKVRQAKFDRDVAVAETIEQGAVAAIAALKIPIYGEAEAIAIGIITAAKVAQILARPIPTYGFGTQDHPGGPALLGDLFQKERIEEPGKAPYWSPAVPTIMQLAPHAKVIPLDKINRMQESNMFVDNKGMLVMKEDNGAAKMTEAVIWQTQRLEKAMREQKKTTVVNNIISTRFAEYVETNVYR